MAEGTYEFECMRAELLGVAKPDQEQFEKVRAERLKQEEEEREAAEAKLLEEQEEGLHNVGGRFDELNTILSSTQQKLNRFKGSLTNIFGKGSFDRSEGPSTSSQSSRRNTTACAGNAAASGNENGKIPGPKDGPEDKMDEALDKLDEIQKDDIQPIIPTEKIRAAKMDAAKKMTSHLDKLDSLLNKADQAEISMTEQTKQMKKMAK